MHGKIYKATKEKAPTTLVDLATAVAFLKEQARKNFDETVELHINLGVDPQKSDQMVRASVQLPSGPAKQQRVAVFAEAPEQAKAKEAGATIVGGEELIENVAKAGSLDADIVIATPAFMPKIAKVARILGPQGLMPNPKTGTVTPDPAAVVRELQGGKLSFKMDQLGNIHLSVGKISWDAEKIQANIQALVDVVKAARPKTMKGQLIRSCTIATTMSPGIKVAV
jgi:large subunit ribosomal protein L1